MTVRPFVMTASSDIGFRSRDFHCDFVSFTLFISLSPSVYGLFSVCFDPIAFYSATQSTFE